MNSSTKWLSSDQNDLLPVDVLIGPYFRNFARVVAASTADSLAIYLHNAVGAVNVGGGEYGRQQIQTIAAPPSLEPFLRTTLTDLNRQLGVDLWLTRDRNNAAIEIFLDQTIQLGYDGETLGITLFNTEPISSGGRRWSELILNGSKLMDNPSLLRYTLIHELGHALGLEHPFDGSDADVYWSTDPEQSATPEQTVMSYRQPLQGDRTWPDSYSQSDIQALQTIWGTAASDGPDRNAPYVLGSTLAGDRLAIRFSEAIKPAAIRSSDVRLRLNGVRLKTQATDLVEDERTLLIAVNTMTSTISSSDRLEWSYRPGRSRDAIRDLADNRFRTTGWQPLWPTETATIAAGLAMVVDLPPVVG